MGIVIDFYNKRFDSPNTLVMLPTVEDPSSVPLQFSRRFVWLIGLLKNASKARALCTAVRSCLLCLTFSGRQQ